MFLKELMIFKQTLLTEVNYNTTLAFWPVHDISFKLDLKSQSDLGDSLLIWICSMPWFVLRLDGLFIKLKRRKTEHRYDRPVLASSAAHRGQMSENTELLQS